MSRTDRRSAPRAMIHKKILDAAASDPDASIAEIAGEVAGASAELVERVLDQYGDPADETLESEDHHDVDERRDTADRGDTDDQQGGSSAIPSDTTDGTGETNERSDTDDQGDQYVETRERGDENGEVTSTGDVTARNDTTDPDRRSAEDYEGLTEGQVRALRLVERNPDVPQSDIAAEFDVTRATISRWLSDIPGFEWSRRSELAPRILEEGVPEADDRAVSGQSGDEGAGTEESGAKEPGPEESDAKESGPESQETDTAEGGERAEGLDRRLGAIERRLERLEDGSEASTDASTRTDTNTEADADVGGLDADLAHRIVHACLHSDRISEEEELRVLKELLS